MKLAVQVIREPKKEGAFHKDEGGKFQRKGCEKRQPNESQNGQEYVFTTSVSVGSLADDVRWWIRLDVMAHMYIVDGA